MACPEGDESGSLVYSCQEANGVKSDFLKYDRSAQTTKGRAIFDAEEFGPLYLAWTSKGLNELWLPGRWQWVDDPSFGPSASLPQKWQKSFKAYFAGKSSDLDDIPVDPHGTPFQRKVWRALRRIPAGQVRSYGSIARSIGSPQAMRAVGGANGANPVSIVIPCHRVVREGNELGGYSGGLKYKKKLLELEGVRVQGGRVLPGQLDLL